MDFEADRISWRGLALAVLSFIGITLALTVGIQLVGLERLQRTIVDAGPVAPLVYILLRASTFIAAPLSSGPIQFAAGILFGLWPGTIYSLIGEVIGGSANFWIARLLGRPVVARLIGPDGMARVEKFYRQVGEAWTLVYARLFLFAIYDFISYAAGFTPMKYRQYVLITVLVGIVPTFAAVAVGTTLTGDSGQLIALYAALGLLCVIPLLFYRRIRRLLKLDTTTTQNT
ncbi:MAG: TVP38/TMEM64 family protein [Chloroflexi bacterium]|nr:TVP38/TMEM64 family protein [Chloroflexota bacterium]